MAGSRTRFASRDSGYRSLDRSYSKSVLDSGQVRPSISLDRVDLLRSRRKQLSQVLQGRQWAAKRVRVRTVKRERGSERLGLLPRCASERGSCGLAEAFAHENRNKAEQKKRQRTEVDSVRCLEAWRRKLSSGFATSYRSCPKTPSRTGPCPSTKSSRVPEPTR